MSAARALMRAGGDLRGLHGRGEVVAVLRRLDDDLVAAGEPELGEFVAVLIAALQPIRRPQSVPHPRRAVLARGPMRDNVVSLLSR